MTREVEVWLRGPIPGVAPMLQPAAHALVQAGEDVAGAADGLTSDQLWSRPAGVAAIGFHLRHLPGSIDRLLTYSRGDQLSAEQLAYLASERTVYDDRPSLNVLLFGVAAGIESAIAYLRAVNDDALLVPREVGRQKLPSTTLGLIFHAAEHSSRHAGQVVTLSRIVKGLQAPPTVI
jgi:hypothetical protein